MTVQDDDLRTRIARAEVKSRRTSPMPRQRRVGDDSFDEQAMSRKILLPQLAFILGAVALIAGRAIAMNTLMITPSTELLGLGEGVVIVALLVAIGLLFGKSDWVSHIALVVGAALAFLGESYYITLAPDLMESIFNPDYVGLVVLNAQ
jgi:hypothetical protein